MHKCPSCFLDCDCAGHRERCEHLCLQFAPDGYGMKDDAGWPDDAPKAPELSSLCLSFADAEHVQRRFYAHLQLDTTAFMTLPDVEIVKRFLYPMLAVVKQNLLEALGEK